MPRTCSVCQLDRIDEINRQLGAGIPYRDIARHFDTTKDALSRHAQNHMPVAVIENAKVEVVSSRASTLENAMALYSRMDVWIGQAETKGQLETCGRLARVMVAILELKARLTGELRDRISSLNLTQINNDGGAMPDLSQLSEEELIALRGMLVKTRKEPSFYTAGSRSTPDN